MNTEFLRGLQEVMLGVIAMTIQQRQGISVQGDTSHPMQTLEMQEETPRVVMPAEEEQEPIEELVQTEEEPEPENQHQWNSHQENTITGETLSQEAEWRMKAQCKRMLS